MDFNDLPTTPRLLAWERHCEEWNLHEAYLLAKRSGGATNTELNALPRLVPMPRSAWKQYLTMCCRWWGGRLVSVPVEGRVVRYMVIGEEPHIPAK